MWNMQKYMFKKEHSNLARLEITRFELNFTFAVVLDVIVVVVLKVGNLSYWGLIIAAFGYKCANLHQSGLRKLPFTCQNLVILLGCSGFPS